MFGWEEKRYQEVPSCLIMEQNLILQTLVVLWEILINQLTRIMAPQHHVYNYSRIATRPGGGGRQVVMDMILIMGLCVKRQLKVYLVCILINTYIK